MLKVACRTQVTSRFMHVVQRVTSGGVARSLGIYIYFGLSFIRYFLMAVDYRVDVTNS